MVWGAFLIGLNSLLAVVCQLTWEKWVVLGGILYQMKKFIRYLGRKPGTKEEDQDYLLGGVEARIRVEEDSDP